MLFFDVIDVYRHLLGVNDYASNLRESLGSFILLGMLTPAQCRAARALLDWGQEKLADRAGVGVVTIRQLEAGATRPRRATVEVVRRALEAGGVEFIDANGGGPGVRLRKREPKQRD